MGMEANFERRLRRVQGCLDNSERSGQALEMTMASYPAPAAQLSLGPQRQRQAPMVKPPGILSAYGFGTMPDHYGPASPPPSSVPSTNLSKFAAASATHSEQTFDIHEPRTTDPLLQAWDGHPGSYDPRIDLSMALRVRDEDVRGAEAQRKFWSDPGAANSNGGGGYATAALDPAERLKQRYWSDPAPGAIPTGAESSSSRLDARLLRKFSAGTGISASAFGSEPYSIHQGSMEGNPSYVGPSSSSEDPRLNRGNFGSDPPPACGGALDAVYFASEPLANRGKRHAKAAFRPVLPFFKSETSQVSAVGSVLPVFKSEMDASAFGSEPPAYRGQLQAVDFRSDPLYNSGYRNHGSIFEGGGINRPGLQSDAYTQRGTNLPSQVGRVLPPRGTNWPQGEAMPSERGALDQAQPFQQHHWPGNRMTGAMGAPVSAESAVVSRKGRGKLNSASYGHDTQKGACGDHGSAGGADTQRRKGGAGHVLKVWLNEAIVNAAMTGGVNALLAVVTEHLQELTCVNISTALHRLARLTKVDTGVSPVRDRDARVMALVQRANVVLEQQAAMRPAHEPEEGPRCWATIAWSLSSLQVVNVAGLRTISELSIPRLADFKPLELTNLLWSFAKTQVQSTMLFTSAQAQVLKDLTSFSQSHLATIVWAYATSQHRRCTSMLRKITEEFVQRLDGQTSSRVIEQPYPLEIANLTWGLATIHPCIKPRILKSLGNAAVLPLLHFKPHEMSITAWAFSRLGVCHEELFAGIANLLCNCQILRQSLHPQGIANILWSFVKQVGLGNTMGKEFLRALDTLLPQCRNLLTNFKPQEFSCALWASAKLGYRWGDNEQADAFFAEAAAIDLNPEFLKGLSLQLRVKLLQAYTRFATSPSGAALAEPPGSALSFHALASFQATIVNLCVASIEELSPSGEVAILESTHRVLLQTPAVQRITQEAAHAALRDIDSFDPAEALRLLALVRSVDLGPESELLQHAAARKLSKGGALQLSARNLEGLAILCGLDVPDTAAINKVLLNMQQEQYTSEPRQPSPPETAAVGLAYTLDAGAFFDGDAEAEAEIEDEDEDEENGEAEPLAAVNAVKGSARIDRVRAGSGKRQHWDGPSNLYEDVWDGDTAMMCKAARARGVLSGKSPIVSSSSQKW